MSTASLEGFELGEFLVTSPAWHCVAEQFKKQGAHALVSFTLDTTVGLATDMLATNNFMAAPVRFSSCLAKPGLVLFTACWVLVSTLGAGREPAHGRHRVCVGHCARTTLAD